MGLYNKRGPIDSESQPKRLREKVGAFTLNCRLICATLVIAPLLYIRFVTDGDAYHFLGLVLIAPVAGLVLVANSLFCFFRYRNFKSIMISFLFVLVGASGFLVAWHFLPQFRM